MMFEKILISLKDLVVALKDLVVALKDLVTAEGQNVMLIIFESEYTNNF